MDPDKTITVATTLPPMSFRIFLLCTFVLFGRPQDLLPALQPFRPALVVTALTLGAMLFSARRNELSQAIATPESKRYWLFYLIMIIGIPFAYHRRVAFEAVLTDYIVNMLYFVFLIFQVNSLQRLKSLVWVLCLCTLMYSVFGGVLQSGFVAGGRLHLAGQMFDPNDTALVLVSLFPLCIYFVLFNEGLLKKLVAIVAILSSVAVILLTGSRGGFLAFGAVMLVMLLTKTGGIARKHKWVIVVMFALSFLPLRDSIDVERYRTLSDISSISSDYNITSSGGRATLWKAAIDLSFANPLTGVGVNCFTWAHYLARTAVGDSYRRYHSVHNSYLQISAEVGLIGFAVFMLMNVRSFQTFLRTSRNRSESPSPSTRELSALSGFMLVGFVGLSISGFFLTHGYSMLYTLYFALGGVIGRLRTAGDA